MDLFRRTNATAVINFRNQCTLATCSISDSYYAYRPSLPGNAIFISLFAFSLICFILQAALSKRFIGFSIAMICGCSLEVLGYAGRIWSYENPFSQNAFLIQIVCLTIAPAFMAAGLYLTLSRIVTTFGPDNSRIAPLSYPRIFIPCDFVSLMLQAAGGGLASSASHQNKSPDLGDHIMVAGLTFQVVTLLIFMLFSLDFAVRTIQRRRVMGSDAALDATFAKLRASWSFKGFLSALCLATLCIFIRSVYRVAELGEGWEGALIKNQKLFIGLEGVMVIVAVLALNAFHPGLCFREGSLTRQERRNKEKGATETPSRDEVITSES